MKVAFLDRDGTVISDYPDEKWRNINEPEFLDKAIEAIKQIRQLGYQIIFISNQYLINEKIITDEQFHQVNNLFLNELKNHGIEILDFFYCPHNDKDNCNCKKPRPGMIEKALEKYPEIDLNNSFYVGDSEVDVEVANHFDLRMFHITNNLNQLKNSKVNSVSNLYEVMNYI